MAILSVDGVRKTYRRAGGDVAALRGVSFALQPGDFAAVEGPSGCGKTTLLLICGALLSPDAGTVTVRGADPYALSPDGRARFRATQLGFVFQQFHLVPYLSVRDNVLAAALGAPAADAAARADELLERFGLGPRAGHVPAELSVGERQRAALARALLNRPALVLADEPTGNLDEANGAVVLGALADYARQGAAVLMVTHDHRAGRVASRALRMAEGGLV